MKYGSPIHMKYLTSSNVKYSSSTNVIISVKPIEWLMENVQRADACDCDNCAESMTWGSEGNGSPVGYSA